MRNLSLSYVALAALALGAVACGPGSSEVKGARTAHYKGDKLEIFHAMVDAVKAKYKIQRSDENTLGMETTGRWFNPEGQIATADGSVGEGTMPIVPDKSLNIVFAVGLKPDGDAWVVQVRPVIVRYNAGSPKPEPMKEDDMSLPGWVSGKTDAVVVDVHNALAKWEVKGVPAVVPAGSSPPPAPAPAPEGSAAAPAPAPAQ